MNDSVTIERELERFYEVVRRMRAAGKIDEATMNRQLDAGFEVEDCFPTNRYQPIRWTKTAVENLRKIRAFNRKFAA